MVHGWISSWRSALIAAVCLVGLVVWLDRQGIGWAAKSALPHLPRDVDNFIGRQVEPLVEKQWLKPTRVDEARQNRLRSRFHAVAAQLKPDLRFQVRFADADPGRRFNAFALPNGKVVVLDGMSEALSDDELLAVLGHEVGHVVHRHSMLRLARSLGLAALASTVMGDFSGLAAGTWSTLVVSENSRESEREADVFARQFAAAAGLSSQTMMSLWSKMLAHQRRLGGDAIPMWLSTHPPTEERLQTESRGSR
jgi:Zn-dependent protease with chaperone function